MLLGISWSLVGCQTISHSIENAEVDKRLRFSDEPSRLSIVEESVTVTMWRSGAPEQASASKEDLILEDL